MSTTCEITLLQDPLMVIAEHITKDINTNHLSKAIVVLPSTQSVSRLKTKLSKIEIPLTIITFADIPEHFALFADLYHDLESSLPPVIDRIMIELVLTNITDNLQKSFKDLTYQRHLYTFIEDFFTYNDNIPEWLASSSQYQRIHLILREFQSSLKNIGMVTKQQRERLMTLQLANATPKHSNVKIYVLYPYIVQPYIAKLCDIFKSLDTAILFTYSTPAFGQSLHVQDNTPKISIIETNNEVEEAEQIALHVVQHLQVQHVSICIITNNNKIKLLVKENLSMFGIHIASSMPAISLTEIKWFMEFVALMTQENINNIAMLSFLKHTLFDEPSLIRQIRYFEISYIRANRNFKTLEDLITELRHDQGFIDSRLLSILVHIAKARQQENNAASFKYLLLKHLQYASDITNGRFNATKGHQILREICDRIVTPICDQKITIELYSMTLENSLANTLHTTNTSATANVQILEPLEASYCRFDLVFMAGLNNNDFLELQQYHPLGDKVLCNYLNFPKQPEIAQKAQLVLSALLSNPKVILSRSKVVNGRESIESKWLYRLQQTFDVQYLTHQRHPEVGARTCFSSLQPSPAVCVNVSKFSISAIERLMSNPYIYYIRDILGLSPLHSITQDSLKREWGIYVHKTIAKTISDIMTNTDNINNITLQEFISLMLNNFSHLIKDRQHEYQHLLPFWLQRMKSIAGWLYRYEISVLPRAAFNITEHYYAMEIPIQDKLVKIYGMIDRIIFLKDRSVMIIEYKTGRTPSQNDVTSGLAPQLPIELLLTVNAISQQSALSSYDTTRISQYYIKLDGKKDQCSQQEIAIIQHEALDGLTRLIEKFSNPQQHYFASPLVVDDGKYKEYHHIIRKEQWIENVL